MTIRFSLEAHTGSKINIRLQNLGWILDQNNSLCNVFQEQAKTEMQNIRLMGNNPDYILYESEQIYQLQSLKQKSRVKIEIKHKSKG